MRGANNLMEEKCAEEKMNGAETEEWQGGKISRIRKGKKNG